MRDIAHDETELILRQVETDVAQVYRQASVEMQKKLDDYWRRYKVKDNAKRQMLSRGEITAQEYKQWRTGQLMMGKRWEEMRDTLAEDLHNSNNTARSIVQGYMPEVYALNHNYATFQIEKESMLDTSYTLYDRQSVERLIRDNPDVLPAPGRRMKERIAAGKDIAWQEGQIQSVVMQSILQGESIPHMAQRIANTMGESNRAATTRYARTAMTGAENAGRVDAYKRAEDMGIDLEQEWLATLDRRTRDSHRQMDGESVKVGERFSNGCRYPGDPHGPPEEIWNCRCTLVPKVKDVDQSTATRNSKLGNMSYEEWKNEHKKEPEIRSLDDITSATLDKAKSNETLATQALMDAVRDGPGELEGLDFRLKGYDSLKRKIHDKSIKKGMSQEEYASTVTDALRYTVKSPTSDFTSTFNSVVNELENNGFSMAEVTNTLKDTNAPYRGINTLVRSNTGYLFELQFHTPESLEIKEINHLLYEEQRLLTTPVERQRELNLIMMRNARSIPTPPGVETIVDKALDK